MRRKAYDKGRSCEGCGSKMPPHFPRKRQEGDGPLLCNSCLTKGAAKVASNPREWYQVGQTWAIDLTNDGHAEVYHLNDGKWGWDVWGPNDADGGTSATRGQAMTDALIAAHELGASFIGSKTASSWTKTAYTEEYPREPGKTYILHFKVQPWSTSERAWNFGSRDEVGRFLRRNVVIPSVLMEVDEELPLGESEVGPFRGREVWPLPRDPRFSSRKVAQWPSRVTGYCVTGDHDSCSGVVHYDVGQWNHDVEGPCQCSCHGTTGSRKVAHDSGDGETIYHCPFCGAGQVIGRSDGTAQCEFCDTAFTVQVQPSMAAVPQTIDGEPHVHPDMPGGEPGQFEDGKDQQPEETEMELEGDEVDDSINSPKPNPFVKQESRKSAMRWLRSGDSHVDGLLTKIEELERAWSNEVHRQDQRNRRTVNRGTPQMQDAAWERMMRNTDYYDTERRKLIDQLPQWYWDLVDESHYEGSTGSRRYYKVDGESEAVVDEEAYIRHLAIKFSDDRDAAIEAVKASRQRS